MEKVIEETRQAYATGVTDGKTLKELDLRFHHYFAQASHNPLIVTLFNALLDMYSPTMERALAKMPPKNAIPAAVSVHTAIVEAVKNKSVQMGREAIRESIKVWKKKVYET